jgi:hypothetical protein
LHDEFFTKDPPHREEGAMNWEGNEILRDECKDGFPSVEYEKFIMKELNNENKSIFLIDDMGKNTFSRKGNIDLKIMHLL